MRGVDCDGLCLGCALTDRVVDGRTSNGHGRLLVAREIGYWRLVEARASVDVDGVGNVFSRLRIVDSGMKGFILTSGCEQQAAVRGEG